MKNSPEAPKPPQISKTLRSIGVPTPGVRIGTTIVIGKSNSMCLAFSEKPMVCQMKALGINGNFEVLRMPLVKTKRGAEP
jgi:hypothetical protein